MNNPLVSIIMPSFNTENYIADSIISVVEQTYENWELIIVDDNSTDKTQEIIKDFSNKNSKIKAIYREKNGGKPSITKNSAFKYINGQYIAFLDSDDLWLPQKLQKQVELMKHGEYGLCYSGGFLIDENSNIVGEFLPKYENGFIFKKMLKRYEINNQSVMIKKELFKKFNEKITIGEDYNLYMEIVLNNKVCNIKEKLVKYRVHSSSITRSKKRDLSEGTIFTLKELNKKGTIFKDHPFEYIFCMLKAYRFKLMK